MFLFKTENGKGFKVKYLARKVYNNLLQDPRAETMYTYWLTS
jgi:hypothetical protein